MAGRNSGRARHSRVVGILKIVLPLTALVLLSLVFLLAETIDPTRAIENAEVDVADLARDPRLTGARLAGVTDDGAALTLETETARSDPSATMRLTVTGLRLQIQGRGNERFDARADEGVLDRGAGHFSMRGGLVIEASPGYRLQAERLTGLLDSTRIDVPGAVTGTAPAGQITAGNLVMRSPAPAESGGEAGYTLVFGGGVRLIYQPPD